MKLLPLPLLVLAALVLTRPLPAEENPAGPTPTNKPLSFEIPLSVGDAATKVKIPEYSPDTGKLVSQLMALSVKRLDNRYFQLDEATIDLNKPDGRSDFRIALPVSIFDTQTRLISSQQPVTIATADFLLQGERMVFDTGARSGQFRGWVYMKIYDSKQAAADPDKAKTTHP